MRELAMDGSLAFAVQVVPWHPAITTFVNPFTSDVPSEAIAFSLFTARWAVAGCEVKSWIVLRSEIIAF
jgi:hypothetical protein